MTTVAAIVPSVPPRASMLGRALSSVAQQTRRVDAMHVAIDNAHEGPGATRTRALMAATADFVVPCDDDDYFEAFHVEQTMAEQERTGADVVVPWFRVVEGTDPFPHFFGRPFLNHDPHIFGCWFLARTELLKAIGGWRSRKAMADAWAPQWNGERGGEDWDLILRLIAVDAKIVTMPIRSYVWTHGRHHHWSGETWAEGPDGL